MNPELKAKELIKKYNNHSRIHPDISNDGMILINDSKQCALICANEVLEELGEELKMAYIYWQEVKQEIEKL